MAKRGCAALTICSTAFETLGRAQAGALGYPDLPIATMPHPFGPRTRAEIRVIAEHCARQIVTLVAKQGSR